jgi:hypothetical protein
MSAYLVSPETIHVIVRGGLQYGLVKRATAGLVGQALIEANHYSLLARYGDAMPEGMIAYELPADVLAVRLKSEAIYGCLRCYDYQACEFEGWDTSAARAYTSALTRRIERSHPDFGARCSADTTGRSEFPWGITRPDWIAEYALPAA